jgi:Replication protein.
MDNAAQKLRRRALKVYKTYQLIFPLIDLHSEMESQYWQSYNCCREVIQDGVYLRFHYCNKRWCFVCNSIRSAKMINQYKHIIEKFPDKHFVTLTRPNIKGELLKNELTDMVNQFHNLIKYLRRYKKIKPQGIRKIEVTFNPLDASYHPHFHLIVDSRTTAKYIIDEWLFRNPLARESAQDMRKATKGSLTELFKYATKTIVEEDISLYAKDIIFTALSGIRTFQSFGIKKSDAEKDKPESVTQAYGQLEYCSYKTFTFDNEKKDWISPYGESLINSLTYFDTS